MSVIASRASWGPRYSDGFEVIGTSGWHEIYVHHSVTAVPGGAGATVAQEQQHMRDLEGIGQREFGGGISYTVVQFPSGRAYQGHSLNTQGAHTYQRNNIARAICFVGNFENEQPTAAAMSNACAVLAEWRAASLPSRVTGGHRDVFATACPGRNLYARLSQITADNGGAAPQEDDLSAEDTELLKQILNQLTGSREVGKFPGYAHRRYGKPAANFTLVDYLREIDRQVNSNLDLKGRPGPELDDLLGHTLSARAEQKAVSVELTDEQAEQINTQVGAIVSTKLDEVVNQLDGLSKDDMRAVLREFRWVPTTGAANPDGGQ